MNVKTDQLIDMLSAGLEPVNAIWLEKTLVLAIFAGGTCTAVLMLAIVGLRAGLPAAQLEWVALKLVLPLSVIGLGTPSLARSMYPGLVTKTNWPLIFFPFIVAIAVGFAMLLIVQREAWIKNAPWGRPNKISALFRMHIVLCSDSVGSPDPGPTRRRPNAA